MNTNKTTAKTNGQYYAGTKTNFRKLNITFINLCKNLKGEIVVDDTLYFHAYIVWTILCQQELCKH